MPEPPGRSALWEVASVALKLGILGFGGPAAHIAMLREEVVRRRKWLDDARFADLLAVTNLIPGPNSTEMVIHCGALRAGLAGLLLAGICFVLPAALMVLAIAWAYERWGTTPEAEWLLYGVKPVALAIVLVAVWGLGRARVRTPAAAAVAAAAFALYLAGLGELPILFGSAALFVAFRAGRAARGHASALLPLGMGLWGPPAAAAEGGAAIGTLFLSFLKIGSVLYGSGYVLLAFLRGEFVERLGWLSDQQLLDAVAVGQVTPGPLFTTATFIGYLVGGYPGAAAATVAIFLPAFVLVAATHPFVARLRSWTWTAAFLDGVSVAAVALMLGVALQLFSSAVTDALSGTLAAGSLVLLMWRGWNPTWLMTAGLVAGLARAFLV